MAWNRSVKCPYSLGLLGCWNVKGWIKILSDSCGIRGFYVGHMALKQWWCLSASVLSVPVSKEWLGSALFLAVSNVTCRLSADRCLWTHTVLTYIINSSLKRTCFWWALCCYQYIGSKGYWLWAQFHLKRMSNDFNKSKLLKAVE